MTATVIYIWSSVVLFIGFAVLLSGQHWFTSLLRTASIIMVIFGTIVGLAATGVILSNGIRLI